MRTLLTVVVLTAVNLRSLPQRLGTSAASTVGVAGVVAVMVAVFSIAEGFRATLAGTGADDVAIVLRAGSDSELSSVLTLEQTRIIADAPGVQRVVAGPVASAELYVIVDVPKRSQPDTEANVPLRGVQPTAFQVRDDVRIVAGRTFQPGSNEIIAGVGAAGTFVGIDLGNTLRWGENAWRVVGLFEGGGLAESELWSDVRVLQPAYRRGSTVQSVTARLEYPDSFTAFKDALTADPRLSVRVERESDYYAAQSDILYSIITGLGALVAGLMGIGAVFGAVNTMYSSVATRTREIATLRALGFGGLPVALSVLAEAMLLALTGGLAGGIGAYLIFNGYRASTLNFQSFSMVVFAFQVTPALVGLGLATALFLGFLGGLFPAVRAARLPVATALREL